MTDNPQPVQLTLDLPTLDSPAEQMFPKLTSAQMARVAARGQIRPVERGEVLFEPGDQGARFFVITAGTVEIVRPSSSGETLIRVLDRGQFTGEVYLLSGRPPMMRARVKESGEVIQLDRERILTLVQTDIELGETLLRDSSFADPWLT